VDSRVDDWALAKRMVSWMVEGGLNSILASKLFQLLKTEHPHHPDKERRSGAQIFTQQEDGHCSC
jgi:hypothetical protein